MHVVSLIAVGVVALIHLYILVLEMFLWTTPRGRKAFGTTEEFARQTRVLAANQGLYNGFLAAGLIWGLVHPEPAMALQIKVFFLALVIAAGIYGAITAKRSILFIQALPAAIALALVMLG